MKWIPIIALLLTGCGPGIEPSFESSSPQAKNRAIVEEAKKGDSADVRQLVRMLDAKEPSTRLLAIEALERVTGERLGYDYAAGDTERDEAVARWVEWLKQREGRPTEGVGKGG